MTEEEFNRQMLFVDTLYGKNSDYAIGYKRALRRRYHRIFYGTDLEYIQQLIMMGRSTEMGRGHRDGLAGREPIPNDARLYADLPE